MSPAIFITYRVTGLGTRDRRTILNPDTNPPTRTNYLRSSRFIEINYIFEFSLGHLHWPARILLTTKSARDANEAIIG